MAQPQRSQFGHLRPDAALLGWLFPGIGHWLIGDAARGAILAVTIASLWAAGLLIGGLGVIDSHENPWWYGAQAMIAPSIAVEYVSRRWDVQPSHGRVNEQGVLYTALAGLLNLLATVDVLYRGPEQADAARHNVE